MSYVVLARKYRPLRFADMIGEEHIGRTLGNAILQNRVHHAYLFSGARGLGKTTTARIFAKALVCERGPTPEPCNVCEQCVAVTEGRSVDVIEIDGASNNSVENIRGLREQVHYLPQSARRKVYIIDEVHMLTTSAFNALLKTLEEPPAHVNFVFATTEPHKVLPTILSRVSRLDFRRVSVAEIVLHLQNILEREGLGVDPAGLRLVARAAGGSVRDAMTLLDQVLAFAADPKAVGEHEARAVLGQAERTAVADLVDALLARDPDLVMQRFDALAAAGHDLTVLSLQMLEDLRDLTVARSCRTREAFVDATADELDELMRRASVVEIPVLTQAFDRLWRVIDRLPTARSQRLVLEMGLLELAQSEPLVPLGDLVERLHALADGKPVPSGGSPGPGRGVAPGRTPPSRAPAGRGGTQRSAPSDDAPSFTRHDDAPSFARHDDAPSFARHDDAPSFTRHGDAPSVARGDDGEPEPVPPPTVREASTRTPATAGTDATRTSGPAIEPVHSYEPGGSYDPSAASEAMPEPEAVPAPMTAAPAEDASPFMHRLWEMAQQSGVIVPNAGGASAQAVAPSSEAPRNGSAAAPRNGHGGSNGHATAKTSGIAVPAAEPESPSHSPVCAAPPLRVDPTEDPFEAWTNLVAALREDDELGSAVLGEVGLIRFGDGVLRLAAPRGSFAHTELSSTDLRARIEQLVRELVGTTFVVELVDGEASLPECPSLVLVERRRREELRAAVEAEAREHPAIVALLRDFDAQLAITRPIGER